MEIDVNTMLYNVPESVFKAKIAGMLLKINKSMGNSYTSDEIAYVSQEIWRPLYFRNRNVPFGSLYSFYDETILGRNGVKKITVQTMMSAIQAHMDKLKEKVRLVNEKEVNDREKNMANDSLKNADTPIGRAACWMISKRCDGYDMDSISVLEVAQMIEQGKDLEQLFKE